MLSLSRLRLMGGGGELTRDPEVTEVIYPQTQGVVAEADLKARSFVSLQDTPRCLIGEITSCPADTVFSSLLTNKHVVAIY